MRSPLLRRIVTNRLDVIPYQVEHKGGVVVGMIMRTGPRRAVVLRPSLERSCVEGINSGTI